ncbi:malto-oligosyltrehalose synthase [Sinorhizobium numidicum]|uniref:Malto-oligosyltrehalose synthase n=1 Tax=Sinorhizobium numidicum TaxID=680248 RepID=A0ABY8CMJ3_9HYPH|nr:malto-oligosyltrehalose synthase [Sinorhizobium numidicum]WEX73894.1 malto-oligosyltrehalose synthase [Sinorhizobium numidicum]WEX79879.1 malto-oligosyltrehalose synthase [Sinorhizobium numidicum]
MRLPTATYRLQFRNGMDFAKAVELIPYLVRLGISHLYASPIFTAVRGSTHGYDVVDCNEIDPVLGGRDGFCGLVRALRANGLGVILDIVPNHMAANLENEWWHSVIEWGRASEYAGHFDIDWQQPLTLPFLGQSFEEEVATGNVRLAFDRERNCLALKYYEALYPLTPASYPAVLEDANPALETIAAIARAAAPGDAARFHSEIASVVETPSAAAELDEGLEKLSANEQHLHRLHQMQPWRLTSWKTARDHLTYRRFFEITGLVGIRVENPSVFADTHRLVFDLVEEGLIDGLRVDHIDGLADPESYLHRLRQRAGDRIYVIVEKILESNEALPRDWPIDGTTGYEFISALAELLTDESSSSGLWSEARATEKAVIECKLQVLSHSFNTEVMRLGRLAARLGGNDHPPLGSDRLAEAIRQLVAALPVYRTYVSDRGASERDSQILDEIGSKALAAAPAAGAEIATILAALRRSGSADQQRQSEFRTRFQQLSGAVMAKAVEDTFFYRRGDYLAANEVGAAPCWRPGGVDRFHEMMRARATDTPHGLSATSTHDTKRGEDARARLYVISEAPDVWAAAVARWHDMNAERIRHLAGGDAPEASVEQYLYQSLLGTWPIKRLRDEDIPSLRERIVSFAVKALREAKLRTSWDSPDEQYETAVTTFLADLLDLRNRAFLGDFEKTAVPFIQAGLINSLSQTLVKLTGPGIPDVYQGSERLNLSLVDPDNRRSFSPLPSPSKLPRTPTISDFEDCKQSLIGICLGYHRNEGSDLLTRGEYLPLDVQGPGSRHAVAFMRRTEGELSITVVPRLVFGHMERDRLSITAGLWQDTYLVWPEGGDLKRLRNLAKGSIVEPRPHLPIADVLRGFAVAFLIQE